MAWRAASAPAGDPLDVRSLCWAIICRSTRNSAQVLRSQGLDLLDLSVEVAAGDQRLPVIPGYIMSVKTAISLPDETFDRVSRRARDLGMSRSEFFTRAVQRYLEELDAQSLTNQIDGALEHLSGADEAVGAVVAIGHRVLDAVDDEW